MRKLEGLKFLESQFPESTVDCLFVDNLETLDESELLKHSDRLFRVRSGRKYGSELDCPQKTCVSTEEVSRFIGEVLKKDEDHSFVIHRVDKDFFNPLYVGTIAILEQPSPAIEIELQALSEEKLSNMDEGVRPRDWEVVANYNFQSSLPVPRINQVGTRDTEGLKVGMYQLWKMGTKLKEAQKITTPGEETYTRFNLYESDEIILDDYRTGSAFIA